MTVPGTEEKWGQWREYYYLGDRSKRKVEIFPKKRKVKVCKSCYETATPEDFGTIHKEDGSVKKYATEIRKL